MRKKEKEVCRSPMKGLDGPWYRLTRILAGPCTMMLGVGADVIKVEPPGGGDTACGARLSSEAKRLFS